MPSKISGGSVLGRPVGDDRVFCGFSVCIDVDGFCVMWWVGVGEAYAVGNGWVGGWVWSVHF